MKKGSLQLSINAIVILILAITMLGLGLGFMRNVFTAATEEFTRVGGTVQKQMIDQMKESDKIVDLDRPKVVIRRANDDQVNVGFRNVQSVNRYFRIMQPGETSLQNSAGTAPDVCDDVEELYKQADTIVNPGNVVVLPINIKVASDADEGTCFVDFTVCANADGVFGSAPTGCDANDEENHFELTVDVKI